MAPLLLEPSTPSTAVHQTLTFMSRCERACVHSNSSICLHHQHYFNLKLKQVVSNPQCACLELGSHDNGCRPAHAVAADQDVSNVVVLQILLKVLGRAQRIQD